MRTGLLRHKGTIEQPTETNVAGEVTSTWAEFATRWVHIEPLTGRELFEAQQFHVDVTTRITMRHLAGVTPKMRFSHAGRIYDIQAVMHPEERGDVTVLLTKEAI